MPEQHNIEWKTCPSLGYPAPHFEVLDDNLTVTFYTDVSAESVQAPEESAQASEESVQASGESVQASMRGRILQEILSYCVEPRSLAEITKKLGLHHKDSLRNTYIKPLLGTALGMTHPENPRHMHQRYKTIQPAVKQAAPICDTSQK